MDIKNKRRMIVAVSILIAICLVVSGIFVYFEYFSKKKEFIEEEFMEVELDDRISPFLNQGLTVQIKRIRNRGLMDKMLKVGTSWRDTPSFYWVSIVDGREHNLGFIEAAGGVEGTGVFTDWDTFGKESKGNFYIDEEQETSEVTITIIEQIKSGLFGRRTQDVEKEKIHLVYNYRTGRWSGDDNFKDNDGYGHYLGEEYEIWFSLQQSDYDHDGIPYWTEVNVLDTNPTVDDSKLDPDTDGCPTSWEWKWGYDPHTWDDHMNLDPDVDGIENIEEYQMSKWFADPYQPAIYIEIDGMEKGRLLDWDHVSFEEVHQMLIERFSQHNINVYIDNGGDGWTDGSGNGGGELLPFIDVIDDTVGHHHNRFYVHNFADERKGTFRYVTVVNNAGFIVAGDYNYYDHILIDTSLRKTYINRLAPTPRYQRVVLAKGILHELGHSMGLMPDNVIGVDVSPGDKENRWPSMPDEEYQKYLENYHSIMNYKYIFGDRTLFDYSDGSNGAPYDQNDWDHVYLPAFQVDAATIEEAIPTIDKTFEDQEVVDKKPGVMLDGWVYDENLTAEYNNEITSLCFVKNADCDYRIYVKTDKDSAKQTSDRDIRVYAKPNVEPIIVRWSLVTEGNQDYEGNIWFYSCDDLVNEVMSMIQ